MVKKVVTIKKCVYFGFLSSLSFNLFSDCCKPDDEKKDDDKKNKGLKTEKTKVGKKVKDITGDKIVTNNITVKPNVVKAVNTKKLATKVDDILESNNKIQPKKVATDAFTYSKKIVNKELGNNKIKTNKKLHVVNGELNSKLIDGAKACENVLEHLDNKGIVKEGEVNDKEVKNVEKKNEVGNNDDFNEELFNELYKELNDKYYISSFISVEDVKAKIIELNYDKNKICEWVERIM